MFYTVRVYKQIKHAFYTTILQQITYIHNNPFFDQTRAHVTVVSPTVKQTMFLAFGTYTLYNIQYT